jgi:WD40 repeat protein
VVIWVATNRRVPIIETYDLESGKQLNSWEAHDAPVTSLSFSADGSLAGIGGDDGTVRLWDLEKRVRLEASDFPAYMDKMGDLLFTPDKKMVITADLGGYKNDVPVPVKVKGWDLAKVAAAKKDKKQATPEWTIDAHKWGFVGFAMTPDGQHFATAGRDNLVKVWKAKTGEAAGAYDFHVPPLSSKSFIRNLAAAPDSKHLVTANANTTLYLLKLP